MLVIDIKVNELVWKRHYSEYIKISLCFNSIAYMWSTVVMKLGIPPLF